MKFSHSPITRAFLNAVNKNLLIETKKVPVASLKKIKTLDPVRDLDDNLVSYSPYNKTIFHQPTTYEDCFERMSFEQESNEFDLGRCDELYRKGEDENYLYQMYSEDDVPLADSIIKKHLGLKSSLPPIYSPSTDLDYDTVCRLKLIEFDESIIPNTLNRKLRDDEGIIRSLATEAMYAWEKGVSTNEIVKLLQKSVINGGKSKKSEPNVDLFKFLTKYPYKRSVVVLNAEDGHEMFDNSAALYYEVFYKKFKEPETALQVLEECRSLSEENNSVAFVDSKLCNIVSLLRKRSALGLPEEFTPGYYYNIKVLNCPPETPWGSKESELIKRLKPDGKLDIDAYEEAREMLAARNCTVDFVLENIDDFVNLRKVVRQISDDMAGKLCGSLDRTRLAIEESLMKEVDEIKKSKLDNISKGSDAINLVRTLNEKDFPVKAILSQLQMFRNLESYDRTEDLKFFTSFINKLADSKEAYPYAEGFISQLKKMWKNTREFGDKDAQIMQFVLDKGLKDGDWAYHKAMKQIIENVNSHWNESVFDYAQKHLEDLASYIKIRESSDFNQSKYPDLPYIHWWLGDDCFKQIQEVIKMETPPKDL